MDKWDRRFAEMAALVSTWSKDPSPQVGAVIADPLHRVVSVGYNGLPHGMLDDPKILENRELKNSCIIHAEENAILFARRDLSGCTIYTYPVPPCGGCASKIRQSGIVRVVAPQEHDPEFMERWAASRFSATPRPAGSSAAELMRRPDDRRAIVPCIARLLRFRFRSAFIEATLVWTTSTWLDLPPEGPSSSSDHLRAGLSGVGCPR